MRIFLILLVTGALASSCSVCHKVALRYKYRRDFHLPVAKSKPRKADPVPAAQGGYGSLHAQAEASSIMVSSTSSARASVSTVKGKWSIDATPTTKVKADCDYYAHRKYLGRQAHQPLEYYDPVVKKPLKGAIFGFAFTASFFVVPLVGILLFIPGLILSVSALRKIKRNPELHSGKGFAVAGIVLGVIALLITLIYLAYLGLLLF